MSLDAPVLYTHDLNQLIMVVTRRLTGLSFEVDGKEGDGIQVNRAKPKYVDLTLSSDGKVAVRSANNDRSGKILVSGIQYSPIHQQFAVLDIANPEDDILDISISDLSNRLLYIAPGSYLSLFANAQYASEKGTRTHEISAPWLEMDKSLA